VKIENDLNVELKNVLFSAILLVKEICAILPKNSLVWKDLT
jgi:hypothetical protein